jgi:hypothetical protein
MPTVNDSGKPFGSAVLTINGVAFVGENISIQEPSSTVEVRDEDGDPSGQITVPGFVTGTTTAQFASSATVAPTIGATFQYTANAGSALTYYVSEVGQPVAQMDVKKVTLGFRKKLT